MYEEKKEKLKTNYEQEIARIKAMLPEEAKLELLHMREQEYEDKLDIIRNLECQSTGLYF